MKSVAQALEEVRRAIAQSAEQFGHRPEDIRLVAVTKFVEDEKVRAALAAGIEDVGENRPQEIVRREALFSGVRVHLIGQLQRNKVRLLPGRTALIHSIDRLSLLDELERIGAREQQRFDGLIQLNVSGEASKSGASVDELPALLAHVETLQWVRIHGLMTIAPQTAEENVLRSVFRKTRKIFEQTAQFGYNNTNMQILSMGMSNDFRIALQEGANLVRIGSAIFGKRQYQ